MIIELIGATLVFAALLSLSFIFTYYVTVVMNRSKLGNEPQLNNVILTQITILAQTLINAIADVLALVASNTLTIITETRKNGRTLVGISSVVLIMYSYMINRESFLDDLDKWWRCGIHPLFQNVIFAIIQVIRVIWGALVPVYNYNVMLVGQVIQGTATSVFKCNIVTFFESVRLTINIFLANFQCIAKWAGVGREMSMFNNPVTNELDITQVVLGVQELVAKQSEVTSCVCNGLTDVFEFFFIPFKQPEIAHAINHAVNVPVAAVQGLIQTVPPWSKHSGGLLKVVDHMCGSIFYTGSFLDQVLMKYIIHFIALFDENFIITGLPKEFLFTAGSRLAMAAVHLGWAVVRIYSRFGLPFFALFMQSNKDYYVEFFSLDLVMEQYNLAIISFTNVLNWGLKVQKAFFQFVGSAIDGTPKLYLPSHVDVECSVDTADWIDQKTCALQVAAFAVPDFVYIFYTLLVELIFKTTQQNENFLQTLQRYDGLSFPRSVELTCKYRASIEYDLTAGECRCDRGFGTYRRIQETHEYPFGRPYYDKYCEQPNLAVNVFGNMDRFARYMSYGWSKNIQEIVTTGVFVSAEQFRTGIKAALNIENIISGDYFMFKQNCGYGLSSKKLRLWYNSTDDVTTLAEKAVAQVAKFEQYRQTKDVAARPPPCDYPLLPFYHTIEHVWKCKMFDTTIRDMMCIPTANPDGRIVIGGASPYSIHVSRCTGTNRAGCECNFMLANFCTGHRVNNTINDDTKIYTEEDCLREETSGNWAHKSGVDFVCYDKFVNGALENVTSEEVCKRSMTSGTWTGPIDPLNQCQCIRNFPDDVMEYVQSAFTNPVMERLHSPDVALHWCNTYWMEWILYYISKYAGVVEAALGVFHPAYSPAEDGTNEFCEELSYTVFDTKMLRYPLWKFNDDKDLFDKLQLTYTTDSCSLYGTTDFVCSSGLALRSTVDLLVNEVRALVMSANKMLDFDFTGIKLTFSERLCDLSRSLAAVSSILPAILPDKYVDTAFQQGISQLIYSWLSMPVAFLDAANYLIAFVGDLITGKLDFSKGVAGPVFKLVFGMVNIGVDWVRQIIHGLGNSLNGIEHGAGDSLFVADDILVIVQRYLLNEAAAEFIGLITKVAFEFIEMLTSGDVAGGVGNFFTDLFNILQKGFAILLQQAAKVMDMALDALGAAGSFIRNFAGSACSLIQSAVRIFDSDADLGCVGGLRRRHLFSAGTDESGFQDSVMHIKNTFAWNGTSECDLFMHAYADYKFDDMRPLEHIKLFECVEDRVTMIELSKQYNITLPEDLLYNWRRKWSLGKQFATASIIFLEHKIGRITTTEMINQFKSSGVRYDEWLPLVNRLKTYMARMASVRGVHGAIEAVVREFDPHIHTADTVVGHIYRIYDISKRAGAEIYKHSTKRGFARKLHRTLRATRNNLPDGIDIIPAFPRHLSHGYHAYKNRMRPPKSLSKTYARRIILKAAGVVSDITPCDERPNARVCINCVVVDNLLNSVIDNGVAMSNYYQYVYGPVTIPSFVAYWEDEDSQSWRENVGTSIARALEGKSWDFDVRIESTAPDNINVTSSRRRLHTSSNHTLKSISNYKRARKDWEWFFAGGWNPWNPDDVDSRPVAPIVLINFFAGEEDEYVPYFAHSLRYYLTRPFEECPMSKMYCTASTYEARQQLIGHAFWYMTYLVLGLYLAQWQTGFPIFTLTSPSFPVILSLIYMFTVYEYTFLCIPSLPNCAVDDFYGYVADSLFPNCFCYYIPALANSCNPDDCFICSMKTEYDSCSARVPLFDKLGILWSGAFWMRLHYPAVYLYFYKSIPFSWAVRKSPALVALAQDIIEGVGVTHAERDCLNLSYVDTLYIATAAWLAVKLLSPWVSITVRVIQHFVNFVIIYATIAYSMVVSLELQAVSGIKEYRYDN